MFSLILLVAPNEEKAWGKQKEKLQSKLTEVNFSADLIRALAMLLVIFVHANTVSYNISGALTPTSVANWWTIDAYRAAGNFGVPLFIMLTGILLLDPAKCDEPLSVFFKKRWARIGIPMIFWTAAYFAWGYYFNGYPFTVASVFNGLMEGSYYHLGFLYLLIGLYLATPILRIVVKYIDMQRFGYFLILWVVGSFVVPYLQLFIRYNYNPLLFVFSGWIGYFLLGVYLLKTKVKPWVPYATLTLGVLCAVAGDWAVSIYNPQLNGFFHEYLIFPTIIASAALFLLLLAVPANRFEGHTKFNGALHWVSQNTLPIFLFHVMILELIGTYLGWRLEIFALPSILEVPVMTIIVFAVTCLILYPLLKMPYVKKIIG